MSATAPVAAPLGQALTRKRANPLPAIILAIGLIVAIVLASLGFLESRKAESVVVLVRDVPYGQQIRAEDLGNVELPLHRPAQLAGIVSPTSVIGQYATRNLGANDLLQPAMLMAQPPTQPVYPNGEALSANMVPLPFATTSVGPITFRDRLNIGFNDPSGAADLCDEARAAVGDQRPSAVSATTATARPYACRLLSSVRVLYVDEGGSVAYLELTPYQAHTIWALQAAGLQLWGERYGAASTPLEALDRLDIGQVTLDALKAPAAPDAIPGTSGAIPGSEQP